MGHEHEPGRIRAMSDTILLDIAGGVATITLNRPDRLNAFTDEMHEAMRQALTRVGDPAGGARCLLLTGAGRGFCAGQDLGNRMGGTVDLGDTVERNYNRLVRMLRGLKLPVIAAVNGAAAGAGANLAFACDIVLAARSAYFLQAFVRIGLVPDSGGTWFLPRLAGDARARGLAMLGDKLPAERAEAWGLIWKCVDDAALMDEARAMAANLATQPTAALAQIKQALNAAPANSLDQQLDLERDLQRAAGRSDDYREGVAAFMEKRAPRFTGR